MQLKSSINKENKAMKKLIAVLMCLAIVAFVGKAAFAEDEDDIMKRHQERMKKVVLNMRSQGPKIDYKESRSTAPVSDALVVTSTPLSNTTSYEPLIDVVYDPAWEPLTIPTEIVPFEPKTSGEVADILKHTIAESLGIPEDDVMLNEVLNYDVMGMTNEGGLPYFEHGYWLTLETDSYVIQYSYDEISDRNIVLNKLETDGIKIRSLKSKSTGIDLFLRAETYAKNTYGSLSPEFSGWGKQENGLLSFSYKLSYPGAVELSLKVAYDENGTLREDHFKVVEHYQGGAKATHDSIYIYDDKGQLVKEVNLSQGHNSNGGLTGYQFGTISHIPGALDFGINSQCTGEGAVEMVVSINNFVFSYYENGKYKTIDGAIKLSMTGYGYFIRNESWSFNEDGSGLVTYRETNYYHNGDILSDSTYTKYFDKNGNWYEPIAVPAELLKQAQAILGDSVTAGYYVPRPEGMIVEGGAERYYDSSGKLVGQHQWDPIRNINEWLKVDANGHLVLIEHIGKADSEAEVFQRKAVEAQIELKGNGKNYTVSPQMADAPKEDALLQK